MHLKFTAAAVAALAASAFAVPSARASAPVPFPVYDTGQSLVSGHLLYEGERLVIRGRPVQLGDVEHHGPAYVAHWLGLLPGGWKGHTLAAVIEG